MTEEFLQYIWKTRQMDLDLYTAQGEEISVLDPGELNRDAGPDFFNARIRIGGTLWAGNVEVHVCASDWLKHGHDKDPAYDGVILHVVFRNDAEISRGSSMDPIPALELEGRFDYRLFERYQDISRHLGWVPCERLLSSISDLITDPWLGQMAIEKLERKTDTIRSLLTGCLNDWEETAYRLIARNMGFRKNGDAFEMLAASLPFHIIARRADSQRDIEALLFGQAGLLRRNFRDQYPRQLRKEYEFLRDKYQLKPMDPVMWKFMRMRPVNFPTVRISQLSALLHLNKKFFSSLIGIRHRQEAIVFFNAEPDPYWQEHYLFDHPAPTRGKSLGEEASLLLTINTVVPLQYVYGRVSGNHTFADQALQLLCSLPAEHNSVVAKWRAIGLNARNAVHSQALIHMKSFWCDKRKCLECGIGNWLMSEG
ncbi:MAG: DUF2851 family protein [Bacteroidales bacterium]|nr:DUF2851 family protein [Bacteroidales bacterium]